MGMGEVHGLPARNGRQGAGGWGRLAQVRKDGHLGTGFQHQKAQALFVSMEQLAQRCGEAPGAPTTRKCWKILAGAEDYWRPVLLLCFSALSL